MVSESAVFPPVTLLGRTDALEFVAVTASGFALVDGSAVIVQLCQCRLKYS